MERCRYFLLIKTIDFVKMYEAAGDEIPVIRCPRAREGCIWEFHDDCVYDLLEQMPTKYWFYASKVLALG